MHSKTIALTLGCLISVTSFAAEISVLSAGAVKAPVSSLAESYRRETGDKIEISYGTMGFVQQKIAGGEHADVVIATAEVMDELEKQGKVTAGSRVALGQVGVGVAVKEGAPVPDISTPEAFKLTLLKARSLVYVDPARGTSGKHFANVLQRLSIAEAVKARTKVVDGGYVVELVAKGEAEIGVQQISEILPVKGVTLVGPLPAELQKTTTYTAGIMAWTKSPEAAAALIRYLTGSEGRALFLSKGFSAPH